jgi:pimeloyl-ACP methyl ester carboxylesterase
VPQYHRLPPLDPVDLWAPLPYHTVEVDGMTLAYVDSGGDKPVLLLVHGLSSYLSFWDAQISAFSDEYRVIALDLPGYGASDRPDAPYTPPWFAEVLVQFMDALGVDQVHLAGHSMGGQTGLFLAMAHPERLRSLVLVAPAGFERFKAGHGRWMKDYWHEERTLEAREEQIRANFVVNVFNRPSDSVERWIEERVRMRDTAAFRGTSLAVSRSIAGMVDHPTVDRLGEVEVPVLIVFGTDDHLIPNPIFNGGRTRTIGEYGREQLPDAELVMIPGAGHGVQHDAPEAFEEAVRPFLAAHP